jgi:hypothetical protein
MTKILSLHAVPRLTHAPRVASQTNNLTGYAVTALWFTGVLTGVLAVSIMLSLARLL